jgi:hypothetical protein
LAVLTARADDFWVNKDWKTWSKAECKKMLEDSPWAKRFLIENNNSNAQLPNVNGTDRPTSGFNNAGTGEVAYYIQLLSAAPVREAFVRQQQIEQKYDKMSNVGKNAFDAKIEQQMKSTKGDVIAIRVVIEANKPDLGEAVTDFWQSLPRNIVPANLYLITEKGTKVPPLTFSFVEGTETEFDVTFPRNAGGEPLIAPEAKSMKVQFPNPAFGDFPEKTVAVEYRFDKMMWNGKLAF